MTGRWSLSVCGFGMLEVYVERWFEFKMALESGSVCGGENATYSLEKTQTEGG